MDQKKTLPSPAVSVLELLLFLGLVPLLALTGPGYAVRHGLLLAGCGYAAWRLFGRIAWRFVGGKPPSGWWHGPVVRAALVAACALAYVFFAEPDRLLALPRQRPGIWMMIILAYPLLSVLPQELIYRVYLFEVHARLWPQPLWAAGASALFFGWVHIVFAGWFAVCATAIGGLLLAATYVRNRQRPGVLWIVALEHALYGLVMFTVGLGGYFFTPR